VRSVVGHSTLNLPVEPLGGLERWQMFVILVTLVIEQLLVNIWMCARVLRGGIARGRPALTPADLGQDYAKAVNCTRVPRFGSRSLHAHANYVRPQAAPRCGCCDGGPDGGHCRPSATAAASTAPAASCPASLPKWLSCRTTPTACKTTPAVVRIDYNSVDSLIVALIALAIGACLCAAPPYPPRCSCCEAAHSYSGHRLHHDLLRHLTETTRRPRAGLSGSAGASWSSASTVRFPALRPRPVARRRPRAAQRTGAGTTRSASCP
jgi:hypothetical protein